MSHLKQHYKHIKQHYECDQLLSALISCLSLPEKEELIKEIKTKLKFKELLK